MKTILHNGAMRKLSPLLMIPELVAQTIKDIKTETRRLKGLDEVNLNPEQFSYQGFFNGFHTILSKFKRFDLKCPYGQVGDIIWVRETWSRPFLIGADDKEYFLYKATDMDTLGYKWKPNIHMPFVACRLFLEITSVRLERLQSITHEGAIAEGVQIVKNEDFFNLPLHVKAYKDYELPKANYYQRPDYSYSSLWIKINGHESWWANPWVWVIQYKRIPKPESLG
jgi:hypothetical protein